MAKMFASERKQKIIEYLRKQQRATVKELSEYVNVSDATLRADLAALEDEGSLQRTHGGAVLAEEPTRTETNFSVRAQKNHEEKIAIGNKAAELVTNGQCILLDASSTALNMARVLRNMPIRLTVVTSGIHAAMELSENPGITVIMIGGVLRIGSSGLEGTLGVNLLERIKVDTMFTSASGFTFENGLMDFNVYEVELKKVMVQASNQVVGLLDYSKMSKTSIASFALPSQLHKIITDDKTPEYIIRKLNDISIETVIAGLQHV